MQTKYSHTLIIVLSVMVLLLGGSVLWGLAPVSPAPAEARTALQAEVPGRVITVVGEGMAGGAPDIARVVLGVQVSDPDVKVATQNAADIMESVLAALNAQGIAEDDIQTAYYNVYVERPFSPDGSVADPIYQVSNTVQVTIRDLNQVTTILGAAIEAGANNVNSVSFDLTDPSDVRSEARQKAIDDARATAEELAQLNGLAVGEVIKISEVIPPTVLFDAASAAYGTGGGMAGPISPGDVNVTVQLEVTYAIVQ